jgi:hypothetical protein
MCGATTYYYKGRLSTDKLMTFYPVLADRVGYCVGFCRALSGPRWSARALNGVSDSRRFRLFTELSGVNTQEASYDKKRRLAL